MQQVVLTSPEIRREVLAGNKEVLLVLAFAMEPTLFRNHVSAHPHEGRSFRFIVQDTRNAYVLTMETILSIALGMTLSTKAQPQVLVELSRHLPPQPIEMPRKSLTQVKSTPIRWRPACVPLAHTAVAAFDASQRNRGRA